MADALVQLLAFVFLRETYAPKILATKKKRLQKETGNSLLYTEHDQPDRTFGQLLAKNLVRPFRMLLTQPAIQAIALYRGYQYGLMYLVYVSYTLTKLILVSPLFRLSGKDSTTRIKGPPV